MRAVRRHGVLLFALLLLLLGTWANVRAAGSGPWTAPAIYISTLQTGTGAEQTFAHGYGVTPRAALVLPRKLPALAGIVTTAATLYTMGTSDATSVRVTALSGLEYYVVAVP